MASDASKVQPAPNPLINFEDGSFIFDDVQYKNAIELRQHALTQSPQTRRQLNDVSIHIGNEIIKHRTKKGDHAANIREKLAASITAGATQFLVPLGYLHLPKPEGEKKKLEAEKMAEQKAGEKRKKRQTRKREREKRKKISRAFSLDHSETTLVDDDQQDENEGHSELDDDAAIAEQLHATTIEHLDTPPRLSGRDEPWPTTPTSRPRPRRRSSTNHATKPEDSVPEPEKLAQLQRYEWNAKKMLIRDRALSPVPEESPVSALSEPSSPDSEPIVTMDAKLESLAKNIRLGTGDRDPQPHPEIGGTPEFWSRIASEPLFFLSAQGGNAGLGISFIEEKSNEDGEKVVEKTKIQLHGETGDSGQSTPVKDAQQGKNTDAKSNGLIQPTSVVKDSEDSLQSRKERYQAKANAFNPILEQLYDIQQRSDILVEEDKYQSQAFARMKKEGRPMETWCCPLRSGMLEHDDYSGSGLTQVQRFLQAYDHYNSSTIRSHDHMMDTLIDFYSMMILANRIIEDEKDRKLLWAELEKRDVSEMTEDEMVKGIVECVNAIGPERAFYSLTAEERKMAVEHFVELANKGNISDRTDIKFVVYSNGTTYSNGKGYTDLWEDKASNRRCSETSKPQYEYYPKEWDRTDLATATKVGTPIFGNGDIRLTLYGQRVTGIMDCRQAGTRGLMLGQVYQYLPDPTIHNRLIVSAAPEAPEAPKAPVVAKSAKLTGKAAAAAKRRKVAKLPSAAKIPEAAKIPAIEKVPEPKDTVLSIVSTSSGRPEDSVLPQAPTIAEISNVPDIPKVAVLPEVHTIAEDTTVPEVEVLPQTSTSAEVPVIAVAPAVAEAPQRERSQSEVHEDDSGEIICGRYAFLQSSEAGDGVHQQQDVAEEQDTMGVMAQESGSRDRAGFDQQQAAADVQKVEGQDSVGVITQKGGTDAIVLNTDEEEADVNKSCGNMQVEQNIGSNSPINEPPVAKTSMSTVTSRQTLGTDEVVVTPDSSGIAPSDRGCSAAAQNSRSLAPPLSRTNDNTQEGPDSDKSSNPKNMQSIKVNLPLPVLPTGWTGENDAKIINRGTAGTERTIEPVGPAFLAHARRTRHNRTFSEDDRIQALKNVKKVEDEDAGEISEEEDPQMLLRDAKDWKQQDHYAVLGLSKYRYKATEEQIKRAHRKKVLRHHPDKKAAAGSTEDDSFFKCIQKATEVLTDPVKRRQFDSVDERAEVEPPTKKQVQKGNFYKLYGPVFKAEGRFSMKQPVPKLGDENSTQEEVENFYNFWYDFQSWRSFEYLDEDVPDDNENRDQKRHMERKNNNARKKKKIEDNARLRKLVDDACALDERIKKFRQAASANKNKKKLEREAAEKKAAEEAAAKKEADAAAAKAAEEAAKAEREQGKKAKEAAKNAVKKNKRVLKGSVKDANYFVAGEPSAAAIDNTLNDVDLVQGKIDADEIAALAAKLKDLKVADEIKGVWSAEVKRLVEAGKIKEGEVKTLV